MRTLDASRTALAGSVDGLVALGTEASEEATLPAHVDALHLAVGTVARDAVRLQP